MDGDEDSCSDASSSYGCSPPCAGMKETAQDMELMCPSFTEDELAFNQYQRPSELQLDNSLTISENVHRSQAAEEAFRTRASFEGALATDAVSIVMIGGDFYRYPDGKRIEPCVVETEENVSGDCH